MAEAARKIDDESYAQRRQVSRDLIDAETTLIRAGSKVGTVRLVDLSPKGFHARCGDNQFGRGEVISLNLPLVGIVPARVMWGLKGCFGAQFVVPIDAGRYIELIAKIRADNPEQPA